MPACFRCCPVLHIVTQYVIMYIPLNMHQVMFSLALFCLAMVLSGFMCFKCIPTVVLLTQVATVPVKYY